MRRKPSSSQNLYTAIRSQLESLEVRRLLSASSLDPTFDGDGIRTDDFTSFDFGTDVVVQPWDEKILVTVTTATGGRLLRYGSGGGAADLDIDLGTLGFDDVIAVATGPGNTIVVAGDNSGNGGDFAVARFLSDGTLDGSFSGDGVAIVNLGGMTSTSDVLSGLAVRGDGSVLLGGDSDGQFAVLQLDSDGVQDSLFGNSAEDGVTLTAFTGTAQCLSMILQADGKALLVGSVGGDFSLARVGTSGNVEFNVAGPDQGNSESLSSAVVTGGGDILAVGSTGIAGVLVKFDSSGVLQPNFDGPSDAMVEVLGAEDGASHVIFDSGGKLLITGDPLVGIPAGGFSISRYDTAGILDTTFDGDGNVTTAIGPESNAVNLTLDPAGRVLAVGFTDNAGDFDLALARYGDAPFLNTPPTVYSIAGPTSGVRQQGLSFIGSFNDPDSGQTHDVAWNFGDGNTIALHPSTDPGALTPTHAYTTTGSFLVTFSVKDSAGATVTSAALSVTISAIDLIDGNLLIGGTGATDNIVITRNTAGITVAVDGSPSGSGFNPTGRIVVILGDGADQVNVASSVTTPLFIDGGAGNDTIKGGNGPDILLGGAGFDRLMGAGGRDLMIGGTGTDRMLGDNEDDILIGAATVYDSDETALLAIQSEWISSRSYSVRVNNLRDGTGSVTRNNNGYYLDSATVVDDGDADTLSGNAGTDWFIFNEGNDVITDLHRNEFGDDIV